MHIIVFFAFLLRSLMFIARRIRAVFVDRESNSCVHTIFSPSTLFGCVVRKIPLRVTASSFEPTAKCQKVARLPTGTLLCEQDGMNESNYAVLCRERSKKCGGIHPPLAVPASED